jgi:hypothetical protein
MGVKCRTNLGEQEMHIIYWSVNLKAKELRVERRAILKWISNKSVVQRLGAASKTEQAGSRGNSCDLYSGGTRFRVSIETSTILAELFHGFRDSTSNQATTASFHILPNRTFTNHPPVRRYIFGDTDSILN